jgi:hypothetical protein
MDYVKLLGVRWEDMIMHGKLEKIKNCPRSVSAYDPVIRKDRVFRYLMTLLWLQFI